MDNLILNRPCPGTELSQCKLIYMRMQGDRRYSLDDGLLTLRVVFKIADNLAHGVVALPSACTRHPVKS